MAQTKLVPKGDWMVVTTRRVERSSVGGIVLPSVTMAEDEGVVEAVGPDVKRAKVGERICFIKCRSKQDGHGDHRYMVQDADVICEVLD